MRFATVISIAVLCVVAALAAADGPIVTTPYGQVQGTMDQGVFAFRGIPFAAPPVGTLRFAPPSDVQPWSGVIDGSQFAPGCMATCPNTSFPVPAIMCTPTTSEDCLYLNVFTPTTNASANLPVIVFYHGGNYIGGSGGVPLYDGSDLARNQNVVVVTTNYRLGVFGALYTGTVRGNFHLQDQRQALKFLQKVVSSFGGNPILMTITGQSAGAASVAAHLASPQSWPYFQRAIILSNPFSLLSAVPERVMALGQQVVDKLGCPMGGQLELECLQSKTAEEILAVQLNHTNYSPLDGDFLLMMMPWATVVEGDEMPYQPLYALRNGHFSKVPILFGTVANESVEFIADLSPGPLSKTGYDLLIDLVFGLDDAAKISSFYGEPPASMVNDTRPFMDVLATDYIFYCVNRAVGAALTKLTPTFMHFFDIISSYNEAVYGKTMPYCVNTVCHADDLSYIFNSFKAPNSAGYVPPTPTEAEVGLAHFMQTVWGNFARMGNPNPLPGIVFPRFDGVANVLVNYSTPVSLLNGYRNDVCDFFDANIGYNRV